jgi:hypothetical protein
MTIAKTALISCKSFQSATAGRHSPSSLFSNVTQVASQENNQATNVSSEDSNQETNNLKTNPWERIIYTAAGGVGLFVLASVMVLSRGREILGVAIKPSIDAQLNADNLTHHGCTFDPAVHMPPIWDIALLPTYVKCSLKYTFIKEGSQRHIDLVNRVKGLFLDGMNLSTFNKTTLTSLHAISE